MTDGGRRAPTQPAGGNPTHSRTARRARPVRVVPWDPAWQDEFAAEVVRLAAVLGADVVLDHIGSTSVPGLCAKPVIDILAQAPDLETVDALSPELEEAGYVAKGEHGIAGRRYFSRPADPALPRVHLHAFAAGHPAALDHLRFRDHLRSHPRDAARYGELKRRLAERFPHDRAAYQQAKTRFVEAMLRAAADPAAVDGRRRP